MNDTTLSAIDALIESFEKNTYTAKHVDSLLKYLISLNVNEDMSTVSAITKVLSFCTKDIVKEPILEALQNDEMSNEIKARLISSCWESGLDYSSNLNVFVDALLKGNEAMAIEAYTLILETTSSNSDLKKLIEDINLTDQRNYTPAHRILINDSLQHLISLFNNSKS